MTEKTGKKFDFRRKSEMSVQETIPVKNIYESGLCAKRGGKYSVTIEFGDCGYTLASREGKSGIFESLCALINRFDPEVSVQFSYVNLRSGDDFVPAILEAAEKGKDLYKVRKEYSSVIREKTERMRNGIRRRKYLTVGTEAKNLKDASSKLWIYVRDVLSVFEKTGTNAKVLNGEELVKLFFEILHPGVGPGTNPGTNPGGQEKFDFSFASLPESGSSVKDSFCPSSLVFDSSRIFRMEDDYCAVSFLQILTSELSDGFLSELNRLECESVISIHLTPVDQLTAIKTVRGKITDIDKMKIDEQKKAFRAGYDSDILPSDLSSYGDSAKKLLEDLQSKSEKMFLFTFHIMTAGKTKKQLQKNMAVLKGAAQKSGCRFVPLDFMQEDGLLSSLPMAEERTGIRRGMITSSVSAFMPFDAEEITDTGKGAMYYGENPMTGSIILADRRKLPNPNGLILGSPGAGKSFAAKREIIGAYLTTDDDIMICDPESEYSSLVELIGGQVIKVSPVSEDHINPMDLSPDSGDGNPLALKSDFILSLMELIISDRGGLTPAEKSIIDRSVRLVYRDYLSSPSPEKMPTLGDLHRVISEQKEEEAGRLAVSLELYVNGSLRVFNNRSNIDISKRAVCFDIKDLGNSLKKIGMLIVEDAVWNRVGRNRAAGKSTRYYIDEMHLLMREEQTAAYTAEIWKRFRKWGGIPTGITQNVKDFLESGVVKNIFENSDFIMMLSQGAGDREILAKELLLSPAEVGYITNSFPGDGLMVFGKKKIPFTDRFPENTELYKIMTTRPDDIARGRLEKR